MTSADITAILDETKCYACLGLSVSQLLELGLLRRWLLKLSPSADTSVKTLMDSSACVACYGASQYELLELALLEAIANAT
jgi:hypothetical protein